MIKLLLIGCGLHARAFYFPAIKRMKENLGVRISDVVDLTTQSDSTNSFLRNFAPETTSYFVEPFEGTIPDSVICLLDNIVKKNEINGLIISTDPLSHKSYAMWAVSKGLHILMDKPITTRKNAALDEEQACGIEKDYLEIENLYLKNFPRTKAAFIICAHRRYHPGINMALDIISETSKKTGCPVTNIHAYHSDGQWRFPGEMLTQSHHSYYDGHGKVSHSGYHFLDCVMRFWQAGLCSGKSADSFDVFSSFVRPAGLLNQLGENDYRKIFGSDYNKVKPFSDEELVNQFVGFGEIDAESLVTFKKNGTSVGLATISLLHNGFSRRSWMLPGEDLYKGNGRVKHEQHRIHVGPFLCIQMHSYQSKDNHEISGQSDAILGGNNHFEINIFRNSELIGGQPLEVINLGDVSQDLGFSQKRLLIDQIKEGAVLEFVSFIRGETNRNQLRSDFSTHFNGVKLMSAIYRSYASSIIGKNPIIECPLRENE